MLRTFLVAIALIYTTPAFAQRPNFLILVSDDQRYDTLSCVGHPVIKTPHLDALAKSGVRFKNAFVTTAICAASRASILTGLHERTHGFTFKTPPIQQQHVAISYPALLKMAGYRTGFVGKFGVQVAGDKSAMFDAFTNFAPTPVFRKGPDGKERHLTDVETDKAIEFLDGLKADEPFCLSVSFNSPHALDQDPKQYIWPRDCDDLYKDAKIPVPRTMSDEFFAKQPEFLRKSESRVRFHWRFDEPKKYQEMVKGYFRMINGVDNAIGRLRAELAKRGLAENTVIVFIADNGYFLGERGFADKWYIYEYSIRVPLVISDPRLPAGRKDSVSEAMALNIDLAPTIAKLAGLLVPKAYQGRNLQPLLEGRVPEDWRTDFFYEHLFVRANIPKSEGVRNERFSYVRWFDQKPVVEELYDHVADFEQECNLIGDAKFAGVAEKLRKRTDELRDQYTIR